LRWGPPELFFLGWHGTGVLLISSSYIAGDDRHATESSYWLRWGGWVSWTLLTWAGLEPWSSHVNFTCSWG
jgi:hypothetical protein